MSIVTYGYGRRTNEDSLVASFGYGTPKSLFPAITDVLGQIVDLTGRVYSVAVTRSWSVELQRTFAFSITTDRIRSVVATARTSIIHLTRSFAALVKRVFSVHGDE